MSILCCKKGETICTNEIQGMRRFKMYQCRFGTRELVIITLSGHPVMNVNIVSCVYCRKLRAII